MRAIKLFVNQSVVVHDTFENKFFQGIISSIGKQFIEVEGINPNTARVKRMQYPIIELEIATDYVIYSKVY